MSRRCSICGHAQRARIERAFIDGGSVRGIAGRFEVSRSALGRHLDAHLPAKTRARSERRDQARAGSLTDRLEHLWARASGILDRAEQDGRDLVALAAIRELRFLIETSSKVAGDLKPPPEPVEVVLQWKAGPSVG